MVEIFLFCQPVNKPRSFISVAKQGSESVATKEEKRGRVERGDTKERKKEGWERGGATHRL